MICSLFCAGVWIRYSIVIDAPLSSKQLIVDPVDAGSLINVLA